MKLRAYLRFLGVLFFTRKKLYTGRLQSVFDLNLTAYSGRPFLFIFDFDDTLSGYLDDLSDRSEAFLSLLKAKGFSSAVYSNCNSHLMERRKRVLGELGVYVVTSNTKPDAAGFLEAMEHFGVKPNQTAMVGDKIGMDMFGSFQAAIKHRILVEPYSRYFPGNRGPLVMRWVRRLERQWYVVSRKMAG